MLSGSVALASEKNADRHIPIFSADAKADLLEKAETSAGISVGIDKATCEAASSIACHLERGIYQCSTYALTSVFK